jgi:signal transduction histidine kinase
MTVPSPDPDARRGRILVADDEPHNRELLRGLLEANGHTVIEAEDGATALGKVRAVACDVILLDVMMPMLNGFEVCRLLKEDPTTAHIPVLLVTAITAREQRLRGIDAGANDYLTKPIDRPEVLLRVRNALYTKRLYDQVRGDLDRLRELEQLRDNLTHMIVHDLRSPLMGISGALEVIGMEKDRLSPRQQELTDIGQSSCLELIEMVSCLLDVSRMEAGQMPVKRTPCDLRDLAQTAARSVAVLAQERKLTLQVCGDTAPLVVDRDLLQRVLVNLLGNAIAFSPAGGTILVDVTAAGDALRVTVRDQGHGIPPEYHSRIFEKFGQVESCKKGKKYSTGLGLTFCKLAVEAHGGQIGVESEVGKGSTFWFTLPGPAISQP